MEEEFVSAELAIQVEGSQSEIDVDAELERVNKELKRYTCDADNIDYSFSVACGILSGIVDAVYVGETKITKNSIDFSHEHTNKFINKYANAKGYEGERLKGAIEYLEDNYKVAQDNIWKGADIGVSAKTHHLADFAHHPTPFGLVSSIIVQFFRVGTFINNKGEWHFLSADKDAEGLSKWIIPVILTGTFNWLVSFAEKGIEEQNGEKIPKAFHNLAHIIASAPIIIEIAKCVNRWFSHLVSDMGGSRSTAGGGMGIPGVFLSMLYEIASLPGLKNTGLTNHLNNLYVKGGWDMRREVAAIHAAAKQFVPVILNEILVRLVFFLRRLCNEYSKNNGFEGIDWSEVVPFGNRTVERMITVASMTFTVADTAEAAVHSLLESKGNWVLFSGRFVTRFNYVGAGRALIAIVKEVSNEKKEAELIEEKRYLMEIKTEQVVRQIEEYKQNLKERLAEYLAEDLETIMNGFDYMNAGLQSGDSNLVIKGNVMIQRMLGREVQFTNQDEFDALMDSSDSFIL